MTEPVNC